ncbi:MAG: flagellar basal body-associated FliL family protein [Litorimonas sp.]
MAIMKKKKGKPAAPATAGDGVAAPKKSGKLLTILAPVLIFGATFGATWFTGQSAPAPAPAPIEEPTAATHSADWTPPKPEYVLALDPMTITAGTRGQTLRLGIAIEVWDKDPDIDAARLRDAFTTYLRALEPSQLADPSFHMRMKRALLHRARVVTGQDVIANVLITDFLLTS